MKTIILLSVFLLASCRKDYVCDCTVSSKYGGGTSHIPIENEKRSQAKTICEGFSYTTPSETNSCTLQ